MDGPARLGLQYETVVNGEASKVKGKLWLGLTASLMWLLVGCGPPKQAGESNVPDTESEPGEGVDVSDEELERDVVDPDLIEFDEEQAKVVLKRGAKKATECAKVTEGAPSGEVDVEAVFDGASGQIVDIQPGSGMSGASDNALNCIKRAFIGEIIPPFKGQKTITHTFKMP